MLLSLQSIMFEAAFKQFTTATRIKPKSRARWRCGPITFASLSRGTSAKSCHCGKREVSCARANKRSEGEIVADIMKIVDPTIKPLVRKVTKPLVTRLISEATLSVGHQAAAPSL